MKVVALARLRSTIGYAVWNLGGYHPRAEAGLSVLVGVLLILHGCWVGLQPERPIRFNRLGLIFIPFLLYAYVSYRLVTPTPWWGREEFFVLAQGGVIYWVAIHNLREKRQLWILISWIVAVGLVSLYFGAREFFVDPTWLPMSRWQLEQYEGRAWGTFGAPNNFGAMMGLLAAFLMLIACTRKISVLVRILSGFLTVLFVAGLVISGSRGGWIGILGVCMALPYFTAGKGSGRIIAWLVTLAGTAVISLLLYANISVFRERVDRVFEERGERTRKWMWQTGAEIFAEHPFLGTGIGSFQMVFERYRKPEAQIGPRYTHNDYLNTLSDLGLVGFLLFFGPAGYLFYRGWETWRRIPFLVLPKGKRHRVVPTSKVFLGAILISTLGFAIHLFVDFHLKIPALLFVLATFFAFIVKFTSKRRLVLSYWRSFPLLWLSLCILLGSAIGIKGSMTFLAEARYMDGNEGLEFDIKNRSRLCGNLAYLQETMRSFREALVWNEEHGLAWSDLALTMLQTYSWKRNNGESIGSEARRNAARAIAINNEYWAAHAHYGMAVLVEGRPFEEARPYYERAVALCPTNATTWLYYARFLYLDPSLDAETLQALERVLKLDPHNRGALTLKDRLSLK